MNTTRRTILLGASALVPLALAGCALTPNQMAVYAQTADNAAKAVLSSLPPSVVVPSVVSSAIATIGDLAAKVAATPTTGTASPAAQFIQAAEMGLPMVASFVSGLGAPGAAAALALAAINAVLPFIAQMAGITPPAAVALGSPLAKLPRMTAAQAVAMYGPRAF